MAAATARRARTRRTSSPRPGRVADLFVRTGARLPGRFDSESLSAKPAEDGPDDLVDRAIVETLRNGGDIFPLGDRGSERTVLAAAYRYPA